MSFDPKCQPAYRFKDINITLSDYLKEQRFRAELLRRQAKDLSLRADQIDEEWGRLEQALVEVEGDANVHDAVRLSELERKK